MHRSRRLSLALPANAHKNTPMTGIEKREFEEEVEKMTDAAIIRALNAAEAETEECDILAGDMERRNLDD